MNKIIKYYTINQVPKMVERKNQRDVSLLFLSGKDPDITKVVVTENGVRNYYIYNKDELILEKKNISEEMFYAFSNKGKIREVKKQVYDIETSGKNCELSLYQGMLFGLKAAKVEFKNEEEAKNFKKPIWFKGEINNPLFEKGLGKFISKEKE